MNILIVTAHPNKECLTQSICDSYNTKAIEKSYKTKIINLYDPKWQQPFYRLEKPESYSDSDYKKLIDVRKNAHESIAWADKIVFIHPLWWGGQPAVLKNFLDCNITSRFAYKHWKGSQLQHRLWPLPTPLLRGKKAKLYITGDGQFWVYSLLLFPFINIWLFFICIYTGIFPVSFRYIGGVRWRSEKNIKKLLKNIKI